MIHLLMPLYVKYKCLYNMKDVHGTASQVKSNPPMISEATKLLKSLKIMIIILNILWHCRIVGRTVHFFQHYIIITDVPPA